MSDAALDSESSFGFDDDEAESRSGAESDLDEADIEQNNSAKHQSIIERNSVPILDLSAVSPLSQSSTMQMEATQQFSDRNNPQGSTRVDLLSQAFRIKPELLKQAGESGVSLERLISNGFHKSLNLQQSQLRFYIVEEIASPGRLTMAEGENKHIAVAVNSSSFSLSSLESLVAQNRQSTTSLEDYLARLNASEERLKRLEFQLGQAHNQLKQKEEENKRLQKEMQSLRTIVTRQQSTPSPVSDPMISPRLQNTAAGGQPSRLSSSLMHLQQLVTDNQQLTSEICRRVRNQTEIEPFL